MKKITARSLICILLALLLLAGICVFTLNFVKKGTTWASYPANKHLYTDGQLSSGRILDDSGNILAQYKDGWQYSDDRDTRLSTIHAVGDPDGKIGTGALTAFAGKLTGYNVFTGSGSSISAGRDLHLTLDSELSAAAYDAMNGHDGVVGVYNYKTGKIICMVSAPAYDPKNPKDSSEKNGAFINKFISSKFAPGSTFKLVTTTAALEKKSDISDFRFRCDGSAKIGGYKVTCPEVHGTVDLEKALNQSCNGAFGTLAVDLGAGVMKGYTESTGLTSSYSINGIQTAGSTFDFSDGGKEGLAWSGIGQGKDLVNPCAMMVFCGAIANGGKAAQPQIIDHTSFIDGISTSVYRKEYTDELIKPDTASTLTEYMRTDVEKNYGQRNFPGLNICAKSGTAQVDKTKASNGWFVGFLNDEDHPLAFVCMVEDGGAGARSAGSVVNTVLQKAVNLGY